ncbi:MAG: hypothetical protein ACI4AQ_02655 [Lachnospiraceae bacterium]
MYGMSGGMNFYDEEAHQGDSILPFLNFWMFFGGFLLMIWGIVNCVAIHREFRIFYDSAALEEKPDLELKKKKMKKAKIQIGVGIGLIILSYVFDFIMLSLGM